MSLRKIVFIFLFCLSPFAAWSIRKEPPLSQATIAKKEGICLTMIVKNEAEEVDRCLNQLKGLIDCVVICDLGSTDKTISVVENFLQKNKIPGKVYTQEWENYGVNRTLSVQAAQEALRELGFSLAETYLLILNPDMNLIEGVGFDKKALKSDAYLLLKKSAVHSYYAYDVHLLRASLPWKSKGVTHEYWIGQDNCKTEKLTSLMIEENIDAKERDEKIKFDIELLEDGLMDEPENERYMFYLAQSYMCLKEYTSAIKWFNARLKKEVNREEICFTKFMIGECYEGLGQWEQALYWYLEAYQCNPDRAESLRKIASHYRHLGSNDLAYIFAKHGTKIPYSDNLILFHPPEYHPNYIFEEELSIAAFYTRFQKDGFEAIDNLLLTKYLPWHIKSQSYQNILFYTENLKNAHFMNIDVQLPIIQEGYEDRYNPMNPSIIKTENGYQVICRAVNYTQMGAKIFNTIDEYGIFRTRNFLVEYDKNFKLLSQKEIIEELPRERIRTFSLEGLDDCRLFKLNDQLWFTCTTGDTNPTGNFQISLCSLADEESEQTIQVETLVPLEGPDPYRCEKNWLPFVKDETFYAVYSCDPFLIYKPNPETGKCETYLKQEVENDFKEFRGSAGPIEFDDGYLLLVHEVVGHPDYTRSYLHRFLYLDNAFKVQKISRPFTFVHQGIEFCCGMTIDHAGKNLIMAVGVEDREALLCSVDLNSVRSMASPLPANIHHPAFNPLKKDP